MEKSISLFFQLIISISFLKYRLNFYTPRNEGDFTDEMLKKDLVQVDVVIEIKRAICVHAGKAVVGHAALFEPVRK